MGLETLIKPTLSIPALRPPSPEIRISLVNASDIVKLQLFEGSADEETASLSVSQPAALASLSLQAGSNVTVKWTHRPKGKLFVKE
jgi:hypothetical protein